MPTLIYIPMSMSMFIRVCMPHLYTHACTNVYTCLYTCPYARVLRYVHDASLMRRHMSASMAVQMAPCMSRRVPAHVSARRCIRMPARIPVHLSTHMPIRVSPTAPVAPAPSDHFGPSRCAPISAQHKPPVYSPQYLAWM